MKQRNFAAAACVVLLAGCSGSNVLLGLGVAGRHLGVGTGLSIPVGSRNNGSNVQDFYESGQKRSDAMLLTRESLYDFRAHPQNGVLTTYAINGNILYQQNFRNGKMVSASY